MNVYTYEFWAHSTTDKGFGTEIPVKENVARFKTVDLSHRPMGQKPPHRSVFPDWTAAELRGV